MCVFRQKYGHSTRIHSHRYTHTCIQTQQCTHMYIDTQWTHTHKYTCLHKQNMWTQHTYIYTGAHTQTPNSTHIVHTHTRTHRQNRRAQHAFTQIHTSRHTQTHDNAHTHITHTRTHPLAEGKEAEARGHCVLPVAGEAGVAERPDAGGSPCYPCPGVGLWHQLHQPQALRSQKLCPTGLLWRNGGAGFRTPGLHPTH